MYLQCATVRPLTGQGLSSPCSLAPGPPSRDSSLLDAARRITRRTTPGQRVAQRCKRPLIGRARLPDRGVRK